MQPKGGLSAPPLKKTVINTFLVFLWSEFSPLTWVSKLSPCLKSDVLIRDKKTEIRTFLNDKIIGYSKTFLSQDKLYIVTASVSSILIASVCIAEVFLLCEQGKCLVLQVFMEGN